MGTEEERAKVRSAIRGLLDADRAGGGLKPVDHYRALFAGHSDLVGEEYGRAPAEGGVAQGATVTSDRPGTPVPSMPSGPDLPLEIERLGPYRVVKELGRGGMGVVYLAEDSRIGRRVALKVLPAHFASSRHLQARFHREAALASKLDHPHICTVYEAGEADGVPYMAMRYLEGKPLSEWVGLSRESRRPSGVVTLPPIGEKPPEAASSSAVQRKDLDRLLVLFEKAARALHAAHEKGLIHRDIKPHNIMVTAEGEPVLLDFGLAREEEGEGQGLTQTGSLMGTPAYLSPEQLAAQRIKLDRRTDVYSLGVALYECLTLRLPFEAPTLDGLYQKILMTDPEDPRRLNSAIPRDLQVVVDTAIERNRECRYQTALDLAEELRRVREHEPIRARPAGPLVRLWRWAERRPGLAASLSVSFLALASGLVVSLQLLRETRHERDAKEVALRQKEDALAASGRTLRRARALALVNASRTAPDWDRMLALLLARTAGRSSLLPEVVSRLHESVVGSLERARFVLGNPVRWAGFSPEGDRLITVPEDGPSRLWDLEGHELRVFRSPPIVLSPDWKFALAVREAGGGIESAELRDAEDRAVAVFKDITGICFHPTKPQILTTSRDGTMRLWDLSGREISSFPGSRGRVAYAPRGDRVLTTYGDTCRVLDAGGRELAVLRGHEGNVLSASFSPRGDGVLTVATDGTARLWDPRGNLTAVLRGVDWTGRPGPTAVFSPEGDRVLTAQADGTACLWDLSGGEVARFRGHGTPIGSVGEGPATIDAVGFSPDGKFVLTASQDGSARVWDLGGHAWSVLSGHSNWVCTAAFSPDGGRVLTASRDGTARLWDVEAREVGRFHTPENRVEVVDPCMSFSPDRTRFFTRWRNHVWLWDAEGRRITAVAGEEGTYFRAVGFSAGGELLLVTTEDPPPLLDGSGRRLAVLGRPGGGVTAAAISPRGEQILTGYGGGEARLWDLEGREVAVLHGHSGAVRSTVFSAEGNIVATAAEDGTVRVWTLSGETLGIFQGQPDGRIPPVFSPRADRVLTRLPDGTVRLWDTSGRELASFRGHDRAIQSFTFSPDGKCVLTASWDGTARLWDLSGRETAVLRGHSDALYSAAFSPDGDRIVTASGDHTVRLWDTAGAEVAVFRGHKEVVTSALFSSGGDRVVSTSGDGVGHVWLVRGEDVLRLADSRITRDFTPEERAKYADLLEPVGGSGK